MISGRISVGEVDSYAPKLVAIFYLCDNISLHHLNIEVGRHGSNTVEKHQRLLCDSSALV